MRQFRQFEIVSKTEVASDLDSAVITDVQRYALHDGPGVRTLIFFKGCPLRCLWCSNPEGQDPVEELSNYLDECNSCGRCVEACPYGAISIEEEGQLWINRGSCGSDCFPNPPCVDACYMGALQVVGKKETLPSLVKTIERDVEIYRLTGGGITATGGEPCLQRDFVVKLFQKCHEYGINTAMETCGHTSWDTLAQIMEHLNFAFYDIKLYDSQLHKALTGEGNHLILQNAIAFSQKAASAGIKMIVRIPIVPGLTDSPDNLEAIADFMTSNLRTKYLELLPYHQLGKGKYKPLGRTYELSKVKPPTSSVMQRATKIFEQRGLQVERY